MHGLHSILQGIFGYLSKESFDLFFSGKSQQLQWVNFTCISDIIGVDLYWPVQMGQAWVGVRIWYGHHLGSYVSWAQSAHPTSIPSPFCPHLHHSTPFLPSFAPFCSIPPTPRAGLTFFNWLPLLWWYMQEVSSPPCSAPPSCTAAKWFMVLLLYQKQKQVASAVT